MTPGTIVKCGPKSKHPGRWAKVIYMHKCGTKVRLHVYPEGHPKPETQKP